MKYIFFVLLFFIFNFANANTLELSQEEKEYLKNTKFNLHMNDWAPFRIYNDRTKKYSGMAIDYFEKIADSINLNYKVLKYDTFHERLEKEKKDSKAISIFTVKLNDRKDYSTFTIPFASYPIALVTNLEKDFIIDFSKLNGKKIAVGKNFSAYRFLKQHYPNINYIFTKNTHEAINKVIKGEVYGAIDLFPVINYDLHNHNYKSVKISGTSKEKLEVSIAVNSEHKKLVPILNQAIKKLPADTQYIIENKWLKHSKNITDYQWLWYVVIFLILLIILSQFRYIQLLKKSRYKEHQLLSQLTHSNKLAKIGSWEYIFKTDTFICSDEFKEIYKLPNKTQYKFMEDILPLIHPNDMDDFLQIYEKAAKDKLELLEYEYRLLFENEEIKHIHFEWENSYDTKGELQTAHGFVQDITEKTLLEQKEKALLKRYKLIEENTKSYSFSFSPHDMKFHNAEGLLKAFELDNKSKATMENIFPCIDEEGQEKIYSVIKEGKKAEYTYKITTPKGNIKYLKELVIPITKDGNLEYFVSGSDITKRVLAEQEKEEQQALLVHQNRLAQLGEMISMIAHQWRQPLNSLGVWTSNLIMLAKEDKLDEKTLTMIEGKTKDILKNLSLTIENFQNFYKVNKEKNQFEVDALITKTINLIEHDLKNNDVYLKTNLEENISVNSYENELSQVLLAIISNSLDILRVSNQDIKTIKISSYTKNNSVYITVEDNAGGIPKDILPNIFDPYFSTKTNLNGTGLGLYMAKMIIEKSFKGKIFASNIKNGARFTLVLGGGDLI